MPITFSLPLILNSAVESGAKDKTSDGSSFSIDLDRPIIIPKQAKNCFVEVQSAEVWNTSPNILTGVNDKVTVDFGSGATVITIPQGLYDLDALNQRLNQEVKAAGGMNEKEYVFNADTATQKTVLQILTVGSSMDFTASDTFRDMVGFGAVILTAATIDETFDAPNTANFNTTDYFLIHCDLVSRGLRLNSSYRQIVAQVLIDVPPGHQIVSTPFNVPKIPAAELIGDKRNSINVWLTNDKNERIDTGGENFSCRLVINYVM